LYQILHAELLAPNMPADCCCVPTLAFHAHYWHKVLRACSKPAWVTGCALWDCFWSCAACICWLGITGSSSLQHSGCQLTNAACTSHLPAIGSTRSSIPHNCSSLLLFHRILQSCCLQSDLDTTLWPCYAQ